MTPKLRPKRGRHSILDKKKKKKRIKTDPVAGTNVTH